MPTLRIAFAALCAAIILFACHSNQKQTLPVAEPGSDSVTAVTALPEEQVDIQRFAADFVKVAAQKFIVAKNKTAVITGKNGLRVTVDPSVLETADGSPVNTPVKVTLIELVNSADLFKANAATVSNNRLLLSGGSYFIGMQSNGQELRIKKGRSLQVDFPALKDGEMELFYGQRDIAGRMNWLQAGQSLTMPEELNEQLFTDSNRYAGADFYPALMYDTGGNARVFRSTSEQVYLLDHKVTIKQLVDTVNRNGPRIFIDTVYMWPKRPANLPAGARIDSNFLYRVYGPPKQFIIKRCKDAAAEAAQKEAGRIALEKARENYQPKTLAGQIQKYYAPSKIGTLGWINCDRFYERPPSVEVQMELPITFSKPTLHYFIIYKEFNGLQSGSVRADSNFNCHFPLLPRGTSVTLVAFVKVNGRVYHSSSNILADKNSSIKPSFTEITVPDLQKMFGNNVRI